MPMTLTLDYNGNQIISYDPTRDDPEGQNPNKWWVTGFNPNYQEPAISKLKATYTLNFSGKEDMYKSFNNKWNGRDDRWSFDDKTHIATFIFK
jgi:hypothetical protein